MRRPVLGRQQNEQATNPEIKPTVSPDILSHCSLEVAVHDNPMCITVSITQMNPIVRCKNATCFRVRLRYGHPNESLGRKIRGIKKDTAICAALALSWGLLSMPITLTQATQPKVMIKKSDWPNPREPKC